MIEILHDLKSLAHVSLGMSSRDFRQRLRVIEILHDHMSICICIYIYLDIHIYIYIYIHIYMLHIPYHHMPQLHPFQSTLTVTGNRLVAVMAAMVVMVAMAVVVSVVVTVSSRRRS